jgi:hypothetical protein
MGEEVPVLMAAQSEARTVLDLSDTGIVVSNPARGMYVCPHFSVVLFYVDRGLATGRSSVQGFLPKCPKIDS